MGNIDDAVSITVAVLIVLTGELHSFFGLRWRMVSRRLLLRRYTALNYQRTASSTLTSPVGEDVRGGEPRGARVAGQEFRKGVAVRHTCYFCVPAHLAQAR